MSAIWGVLISTGTNGRFDNISFRNKFKNKSYIFSLHHSKYVHCCCIVSSQRLHINILMVGCMGLYIKARRIDIWSWYTDFRDKADVFFTRLCCCTTYMGTKRKCRASGSYSNKCVNQQIFTLFAIIFVVVVVDNRQIE